LDKNTFLTIKLTAAESETVATDMLTTSGGVEKKTSLSTPALPISTPVTSKPIAGLSLYHRLAFVRYLSLKDKQVVPRHHYFAIHHELSLRKQTKNDCEANKTALL
jgi:hypothetical protein